MQAFCEEQISKSVTSVRHPKMKRDAGVNAVFFLSKKTAFTPASLFIFVRRTEVMALRLKKDDFALYKKLTDKRILRQQQKKTGL